MSIRKFVVWFEPDDESDTDDQIREDIQYALEVEAVVADGAVTVIQFDEYMKELHK